MPEFYFLFIARAVGKRVMIPNQLPSYYEDNTKNRCFSIPLQRVVRSGPK